VFSLYLITDGSQSAPQLCAVLARALAAAPPARVAVQLRAKALSPQQQYALALELQRVCRDHGTPLLINDRIDLALAIGADGVHLPETSLPLTAARRLLGERALIGVSCHDARGLESAQAGGANFACLSPVFESPGKGTPLGLRRFAALTRVTSLPVLALGGVQAQHARSLRAAGAVGLAVVSAVFGSPDPAAAVSALLTAWDADH
jgi:thiamine-phosphate pyrophosphorylase